MPLWNIATQAAILPRPTPLESGAADAGALDETVYNSMVCEGKLDPTKVRVFYTSKPFVDYVWVGSKGVDQATQEKFVQAFTDLREGRSMTFSRFSPAGISFGPTMKNIRVLRLIARDLNIF
jgi:phosphonate transport system substrate-binding protein